MDVLIRAGFDLFMAHKRSMNYYSTRWPEDVVPAGEPQWLYYEVDLFLDAVLRTVEVFPDGSVARNSVDLEQLHGDHCPSLIDCSWREAAQGAALCETSRDLFEELWLKGADKPIWFGCK